MHDHSIDALRYFPKTKMIGNKLDNFILAIIVVVFTAVVAFGIGRQVQAETMTDRCATTGMYLTEGYAISCKVLTNEGYSPMIEQQKGK